jgi:hypothetical protein
MRVRMPRCQHAGVLNCDRTAISRVRSAARPQLEGCLSREHGCALLLRIFLARPIDKRRVARMPIAVAEQAQSSFCNDCWREQTRAEDAAN